MGLSGEAGEACDKVKKLWRNLGTMNGHDFSQQAKTEIIKELGDVLWYITAVAQEIGSSLEAVALANKLKLTARREAGTIKSEGDNR
jgi:NTP pyrophosphatase (non-canonical NTP hydrolase)